MLNNHIGTVKRLLQEPGIDVNGKDDKGRTLLSFAMMDLSDPSCIDFTKFLLEKGADVNMTDVEGNCPLVLLAPHLCPHNNDPYVEEARKTALVLVDLLISHGANINTEDKLGRTLLMSTMVNISVPSCLETAKYLIEKGADPKIETKIYRDSAFYHLAAHFKNRNGYG
jgi:ankyrin repeat protein